MVETQERLPTCFYCEFDSLGFPCRDRDGKLNADKLVEALLVTYREDVDTPSYDENFWAFECMVEIVRNVPKTAFGLIVLALMKCSNDREIAILAAGPLEDILYAHGVQLIDAIEREAARNEKFRYLLSGVWGESHVNPAIWHRIQAAVRNGPWIDQDPRTPQGSDKFSSEK